MWHWRITTAIGCTRDAERAAELLSDLGAIDVYILEGGSARRLIGARENAFWAAKEGGVDDIIDVVVPRASMPQFLRKARELALAEGAGIGGCGHAGDGNVHGVVFCKDPEIRKKLLTDIFAFGMELGGAISGEHGLGRAKTSYFLELEDPAKVALMRRIKQELRPGRHPQPGRDSPLERTVEPSLKVTLSSRSSMIEHMFDLTALSQVDGHSDEAALIDQIAALERVKSAAAAGQARAAAALDQLRRADEAAARVPASRRGRGVASEIALARRDSPARGGRHLGFAKALVHEMPHTLAALECGVLSEWRATLIVRESACLDVEDRRVLDGELCADVSTARRDG